MSLNMELGLLVRGGDTTRALDRLLRGLIAAGVLKSLGAPETRAERSGGGG